MADKPLVRDLMTANPVVINPDVSTKNVMALMQEAGIRHLPVVDDEGIAGMVSDRDLTFIHGVPGVFQSVDTDEVTELLELPISIVMKSRFLVDRDVTTIREDQPLRQATDLLVGAGVGAIPVLNDGGEVVGILSTVDVVRWVTDKIL